MLSKIRKVTSQTFYNLLLPLSFFIPAITWRSLSFISFEFRPSLIDLRGVSMDLIVSMILSWLVMIFSRYRAIAMGLVLIIWCLVLHGSYQNVMALQAFPNVTNLVYLGDATFIAGSVMDIEMLIMGSIIIFVSLGISFLFIKRSDDQKIQLALSSTLVVAGCIACLTMIREVPYVEHWRMNSCLVKMTREAYSLLITKPMKTTQEKLTYHRLSGLEKKRISSVFKADLNGTKIFSDEGIKRPNVLLVVIEGLCGAYVPKLREIHGAKSTFQMPTMDRLHRNYLSVPNYILHQRQTNRGMYSILSGRLPNLLSESPKMSTSNLRPSQKYLPESLVNKGYKTVYLQATDLGFMMTDIFMKRAGFQKVFGSEVFSNPILQTGWGVDDGTLFRKSVECILDLEKMEHPWFMTVLTVGSHHPYGSLIPLDFKPFPGESEKARSFRYSDHVLGKMLEKLDKKGILRNTMVIITSDESASNAEAKSPFDRMISSNWGSLVIRLPDGRPYQVNGPYGQSDIALSILDYLGMVDESESYTGRSVFREYQSVRSMFFANNSLRKIGSFRSDGVLQMVSENEGTEDIWRKYSPDSIFKFLPTEPQKDWSNLFKHLGNMVREEKQWVGKKRTYTSLIEGSRTFENLQQKNFQWVFGGQYLQYETDVVMKYELEVMVTTGKKNKVYLKTEHHHHPVSGINRDRITSRFTCKAENGTRLLFNILYRNGGDYGAMELNQYVKSDKDVPVKLTFLKAVLSAVPTDNYPLEVLPRKAIYKLDKI